ncbi:MAG: SGNH hydrolase domain-containing protein, partial [Cyanobacteria bacterium J06607_6]
MAGLGVLAGAIVFTGGMANERFSKAQLAALSRIVIGSEEAKSCAGARPISKLCSFGAADREAAPRWLLWGDSHAGSMLPALITLVDERQRRVIFANKGNCPPLPGVIRSDMPPSENTKCERLRQNVLEMTLSDDRIETVFLVARWPMYGEGHQLPSEGGARFTLIDSVDPRTRASNLAVIQAALGRLSRKLIDKGKNVVIVRSAPELPWNAVHRIEADILFGVPFNDDQVSLAEIQLRQAKTNAVLEAVGEVFGLNVVALAKPLCAQGCPVRSGVTSFYRDNNHFTPIGAELLVPILDQAIPYQNDQ